MTNCVAYAADFFLVLLRFSVKIVYLGDFGNLADRRIQPRHSASAAASANAGINAIGARASTRERSTAMNGKRSSGKGKSSEGAGSGGGAAKNTRKKDKIIKAIVIFVVSQIVGAGIFFSVQRAVILTVPPPPSDVRIAEPGTAEAVEHGDTCPMCRKAFGGKPHAGA